MIHMSSVFKKIGENNLTDTFDIEMIFFKDLRLIHKLFN